VQYLPGAKEKKNTRKAPDFLLWETSGPGTLRKEGGREEGGEDMNDRPFTGGRGEGKRGDFISTF